jgi:DNA adenine methylase Dam
MLKPFNYTGSKHKVLKQIYDLLGNNDINQFVEPFGGSGVVGLNINSKYPNIEKIYYNESNTDVYSLFRTLLNDHAYVVWSPETLMEEAPKNKEEYLALRDSYNKSENKYILDLFKLITTGFNNQIRFNKSGEFNTPYGDRKFNSNTLKQLVNLRKANGLGDLDHLFDYSNMKCSIFLDFIFSMESLDVESTFIYFDPPYLNSVATYTENDTWNETHFFKMTERLDELTKLGYKWGLSEMSENKGIKNELLMDWINSKGYAFKNIDLSYTNSSATKKVRSGKEIYIYNY